MAMFLRPTLIGAIAGLLGAGLLIVYLQRYEMQTSGGEKVDVLIALQRIERGTSITEDKLGTRAIPQAYVDDRAIRARDKEKILGIKAAESVAAAQTVLWSDVVVTSDERRDLSSLVQPGNRAVTAPFAANPAFNLIRPGDFVDVIGVMTPPDRDEREAVVLLQRVLVLAIGSDTAGEQPQAKGGSARAPSLTLSLSLQEAQLLSLAAQRGTLAVALRNPGDQRITEAPPELSADVLFRPPARESMREARHVPSGPARLEVAR